MCLNSRVIKEHVWEKPFDCRPNEWSVLRHLDLSNSIRYQYLKELHSSFSLFLSHWCRTGATEVKNMFQKTIKRRRGSRRSLVVWQLTGHTTFVLFIHFLQSKTRRPNFREEKVQNKKNETEEEEENKMTVSVQTQQEPNSYSRTNSDTTEGQENWVKVSRGSWGRGWGWWCIKELCSWMYRSILFLFHWENPVSTLMERKVPRTPTWDAKNSSGTKQQEKSVSGSHDDLISFFVRKGRRFYCVCPDDLFHSKHRSPMVLTVTCVSPDQKVCLKVCFSFKVYSHSHREVQEDPRKK